MTEPPATSYQLPAADLVTLPADPTDKAREHATDLLDLAAPLFEQRRWQESEVPRKKEIILKFVG